MIIIIMFFTCIHIYPVHLHTHRTHTHTLRRLSTDAIWGRKCLDDISDPAKGNDALQPETVVVTS